MHVAFVNSYVYVKETGHVSVKDVCICGGCMEMYINAQKLEILD